VGNSSRKSTPSVKKGKQKKDAHVLFAAPLSQFRVQPMPDTYLGLLPFLDWDQTERRARAGDLLAARVLLMLVVLALRGNKPVSVRTKGGTDEPFVPLQSFMARYVADALDVIARGGDPWKALNLVANPGSKKFVRDDWVEYIVRDFQLSGDAPEVSYGKAADMLDRANVRGPRTGWSADTVCKIIGKRSGKKRP
jgi:hypothetical protein